MEGTLYAHEYARGRDVNFSEQPPSTQWMALKYRGEVIAEVWFKPEGEPLALAFRIPQSSFRLPGTAGRLTTETLLKSVGIALEEAESWCHEGESNFGPASPLPPPPRDVDHLLLWVSMKPPAQAAVPQESAGPEPQAVAPERATEGVAEEIPESKWQDLEARWNAILLLEASLDTLRISMEGLRAEMESSSRRSLNTDEKVNALNADVAQWNKAKSRVQYSLPKAKDFVHRATWAAGAPERKKLDELFKTHVEPRVPFAGVDEVLAQLEHLLKDRQVLSALGTTAFQECKGAASELQGALRTLQSNAAANAIKKRAAATTRGKVF
jgi:hypothetical protein